MILSHLHWSITYLLSSMARGIPHVPDRLFTCLNHLSFLLFPLNSSSSAFFGVGSSSFQYRRSSVLCFFYLYSFVFSYNITRSTSVSVFLYFGVNPLPSSMFSLLHLLQSLILLLYCALFFLYKTIIIIIIQLSDGHITFN